MGSEEKRDGAEPGLLEEAGKEGGGDGPGKQEEDKGDGEGTGAGSNEADVAGGFSTEQPVKKEGEGDEVKAAQGDSVT